MGNKVISELDLITDLQLSTADSLVVNDASDGNKIKRTTIENLAGILTGNSTFSFDLIGDLGVQETISNNSSFIVRGGAYSTTEQPVQEPGIVTEITHTDIPYADGDYLTIYANTDVLATKYHVSTRKVDDLNNVNVDAVPNDNNILAFDTATGKWTNQDAIEAGLIPAEGAVSIHIVGTIDFGTWNATKISPEFGGTGADFSYSSGMHTGIVTFANSTATLVAPSSGPIDAVYDEDDMSSNSATALVTQQSVIAFVESKTSQTMNVTVSMDGSISQQVFHIDGNPIKNNLHVRYPLHFQKGGNYRFDVSNGSMIGKQIRFSTTPDGVHNGGIEYTEGVEVIGNPGEPGSYVNIQIKQNAPDILYVYEHFTPGLGGSGGASSDDQRTPVYTTDTNGWIPIIGNRTASKGDKLLVDCETGPVTIQLPVSAQSGDTVKLIDVTGSSHIHNIIVDRNGHKIMKEETNFVIATERGACELVYYDEINGWVLTEN
tara:strand:+ start:513 stop:1982 length:1470 start_codon:yes stop_codon:yes gene_type:complete